MYDAEPDRRSGQKRSTLRARSGTLAPMNDPTPPPSPVAEPQAPSSPPVRLFDPEGIALATFLGSALAGSVLWAINERRLGRPGRALGALAVGVVVLVAALVIGSFLPSQVGWVIALVTTFAARAAATAWRQRVVAEGFVIDDAAESRGTAAGVGCLGFLGVLGVLAVAIMGFGLFAPGEGDPCDAGTGECEGDRAALFCLDGTMQRFPCNGPRGCTTSGDRMDCDATLGAIGEPCWGAGASCAADGTRLDCRDHVFARAFSCVGPAGCHVAGGEVQCDQPRAVIGDPCDATGAICSTDGDAMLECEAGHWSVHRHCRGARGCAIVGDLVDCDQSLSAVGDACGSGDACSVDGSTLLTCADGAFVVNGPCPGPARCQASEGRVLCDPGSPPVPEPAAP